MVPDEPGQLAIARFVGRGLRWNMLNHSTWRPGYGVLLAPATWITDDAVGLYRSGLLLNAGLGALSCVLLALLAARLTGRSIPTCAALAAAVSLAPALVFTTDWVWSEALVQVTLLLFLLAAVRFLDVGRLRWGITMVVAAAAGFATHSRLLPLAVTATALVVVACWRRELTTRHGIALLALLAFLLLAVARFSSWLVERIWETPAATNTAGGVLDRLTAPGSIAVSGTGQLWYQLVASAGLAGVGAIALVRSASRRAADDRPGEPTAVDARILLVAIAPLIGLSVVFMSDRWRPDQIIYGRYNDPATAVMVLVGLATLLGASRRRLLVDGAAVLGALAVTAVVLWATEGDVLAATAPLRAMVLGVLPFSGRDPVHVLAVTLAAGVVIVAVVAAGLVARRARGAVLGVVVVALLVTGYVRTRPTVDGALNSWSAAAGAGRRRGAAGRRRRAGPSRAVRSHLAVRAAGALDDLRVLPPGQHVLPGRPHTGPRGEPVRHRAARRRRAARPRRGPAVGGPNGRDRVVAGADTGLNAGFSRGRQRSVPGWRRTTPGGGRTWPSRRSRRPS